MNNKTIKEDSIGILVDNPCDDCVFCYVSSIELIPYYDDGKGILPFYICNHPKYVFLYPNQTDRKVKKIKYHIKEACKGKYYIYNKENER